jgi:N-acetylglucosamine-6-phosphate deacetylase
VAISYTTQHYFDGQVLHPSTEIVVHDGIIEAIRPYTGAAEHFVISPGLIDVQMNGFGTVDVSVANSDDFAKLDADLLSHGTTSWLATVVTAPLDRLDTSIRLLDSNISNFDTGCVGVHVEGPFLGKAPGAHNPSWIIPFDDEWCAQLPTTVKLITVAPEQINVNNHIQQLVNRGICVSLGHTEATEQQWNEAVAAGSQMVTHLFNGMSGIHHRTGGVALFALTDERIVCGLIADMVHVSPRAVSLAFATKGHNGICLVSDSIAWDAQWAQRRGIKVLNGAPRLPDGTLAGSSTPLSQCVQHVVQKCGVSLASALASATSTPASILGYPQLGRVIVGQRADLAVFDDELSVVEGRRGLVSSRG